jgi:hypothetical protein
MPPHRVVDTWTPASLEVASQRHACDSPNNGPPPNGDNRCEYPPGGARDSDG